MRIEERKLSRPYAIRIRRLYKVAYEIK